MGAWEYGRFVDENKGRWQKGIFAYGKTERWEDVDMTLGWRDLKLGRDDVVMMRRWEVGKMGNGKVYSSAARRSGTGKGNVGTGRPVRVLVQGEDGDPHCCRPADGRQHG
jgi:hypothetical protein